MAQSARALPNLWRLFLVANPVVILNTTGAVTGNSKTMWLRKIGITTTITSKHYISPFIFEQGH